VDRVKNLWHALGGSPEPIPSVVYSLDCALHSPAVALGTACPDYEGRSVLGRNPGAQASTGRLCMGYSL